MMPFQPSFRGVGSKHIIKPIDIKLRQRAHHAKTNGNPGDDNNGGIKNLLAYVDDLNCVIPIEDSLFLCETF